ncbi:MAG TPA: prepilin-type N-terminal cleavage/methylation domain-containing protein [Fimbriimonadaceae bacterium]|nr:prepilin-type N-terminal cleavage/methylation domain-containing protein [Fimbriimonadaceae bacterium]
MKRAFTLIELLVVIAIIAILAAILFPVYAQAKLQAKKAADLSNIKQHSMAMLMYTNDSDDVLVSPLDPCLDNTNALTTCGDYTTQAVGLTGPSLDYLFWMYKLQPYIKNFGIFKDSVAPEAFTADNLNGYHVFNTPEAAGGDWGGQNSYAYNSFFLSPANSAGPSWLYYSPITTTTSPRVASTFMFVDGGFHIAAPDVLNASGYTAVSHLSPPGNGLSEANYMTGGGVLAPYATSYWENAGGSDYTYQGDPAAYAATAIVKGKSLFAGKLNASFVDGHAKTMNYQQVVGDICFWSVDMDGPHNGCS